MRSSPGTTIDRETYIADVRFARRFNTFGAWCGVAFVILLFGGWGLIGGFIPLIPATASPSEIAARINNGIGLHRFGLTLGMIGVFVTAPFYLAISAQLRRAEPRLPLMSALQLIAGVVITVILTIPMLFFIVLAFRPERPTEITQLMNDMSYIMLILPWPPIILQLGAIAATILRSRPAQDLFPRWYAYFNLWIALLVVPANMIIFFKEGPFAWTGLIGFWIPAAVFGAWYPVTTWALLRAGKEQYESDLLHASDYPLAGASADKQTPA